MLFNFSLNKRRMGTTDQQDSHRDGNEVVDAVAVKRTQVHQKAYAENRAGNTAYCKRQHNSVAYGSMADVHPAGTDFGDEIEQRVGADSQDRRHPEAEDQHGQQQYATAQAGHSNQGADYKADQDF